MQILQKMSLDNVRVLRYRQKKRAGGFTLLETLIALGILASIAVQLLSVQSNTISVTQMARDNMRATWALKSILAQMNYVIEVYGLKALPSELELPWSADKDFKVRLKSKEVSIEASKVFLTVMKLQKQLSMEDPQPDAPNNPDEANNQMKQMEPVFAILDNTVPKDIYRQIIVEVEWPDGDKKKQISSGLFLVDQKGIKALDNPGMGALGNAPKAREVPLEPQSKGVTLLEILISVGILATISLFAINSISAQLENRNRLSTLNENQHGIHVAMGRLSNDLSHVFIINRKDVAEANESARAVKPFLTHTNEEGGVKFTTQGSESLRANSGESNIAVVKFMVRQDPKDSNKQQLIRVVDTVMKESIDRSGVGVEQILLPDVKEFKVTYWNGNDFVEGWDTTTGDKANKLPKMARLRLETYVPLREGETPPADKGNRKTLAVETIVYLLFSYGETEVQTPPKEYQWK